MNLKNKLNLKILEFKDKFNLLKPSGEVVIDIAASCNANCPFCPRIYMPKERASGFMNIDLFKYTLDKLKSIDIGTIRLYSTAEPMLHPKFDILVNIARQKGFKLGISTNGSMIHKYIDSLLEFEYIQLSIEGWDKESYEKYRTPLKFENTLKNIKLLHNKIKNRKNKPFLMTNLLITKKTNYDKYLSLWGEFFDAINVHFMSKTTLYEKGKFVSKINEELKDEYYEFIENRNKICNYPFKELVVSYDGKISLCCNDFFSSFNLGTIYADIVTIWNNKIRKQIRNEFYNNKFNICRDCSIFYEPTQEAKQEVKQILNKLNSPYKSKLKIGF